MSAGETLEVLPHSIQRADTFSNLGPLGSIPPSLGLSSPFSLSNLLANFNSAFSCGSKRMPCIKSDLSTQQHLQV